MKTPITLLLALTLFTACSDKLKEEECPKLMCTEQFAMVRVLFKDAQGKPVAVSGLKIINKRTKEELVPGQSDITGQPGYYTIADDGMKDKFSTGGDTVTVTASNPATKKPADAMFVISGGKCACHINKVSGPEEVVVE